MPKGGVLTIRTERKIVDAPVPVHGEGVMAGAHIVVSVKDTGMGVAKENMERILNPFHQQGCRRSHQIAALRRVGIITQTGGPITVESVGVGQGVVFTIYLARLGRRISRNTMNPNPRWRGM
jgi:two-component system, cell cycle sensor histidine kinase and response regulator CckA